MTLNSKRAAAPSDHDGEFDAQDKDEGAHPTHMPTYSTDSTLRPDPEKESLERDEDQSARLDLAAQKKEEDDVVDRPPGSAGSTIGDPEPQPQSRWSNMKENGFWKRCWDIATWTPPRCRWNPEDPPKFSMGLNFLFGFAGTFTVANLYYNHPILNILAADFNVTYEQSSIVPTVMQAGYAAGLLFLCPLGDIFKRRAFVLILVWFTATVWLGLCITTSFPVFVVLSFITAVSTVTPQLMLPLVGDLAPPHKRAMALSIVVSGLLLGMLIARLLSGVLTQYTSWRNIYWLSFALQYFILVLLWLFMPDYPSTNPEGINYFRILYSVGTMVCKHPVLVQACLIGFCTSSIFTSFWTTLTFLLADPPYNYDPVVIGLFALIGIGAMTLGPPYSKAIIDRFVPIFSVILGELMCLIGVIIGTYVGPFSVAGPIIEAFAIDIGLQTSQIANRSAIYAIEPKARNRVNTAYMVAVFSGQLTGTAVGNRLYAEGGWTKSGACSIGFVCGAILVCFVRGPWNPGWIGWKGGWDVRRRDLPPHLQRKGKKGKNNDGQNQTQEAEPGAIEEGLDEMAAEGVRVEEPKRAVVRSHIQDH